MRRFFFNEADHKGDVVLLSPEESHHLVKVLRLKAGDEVELLDGLGGLFRGVVVKLGKRVTLRVELLMNQEIEATELRVFQALLKGEKMETVIQKCTELGVTRFTPFHSSRCQGRLNIEQVRKKSERWQRIVSNACKQCLRSRPMILDTPRAYQEVLVPTSLHDGELKLLFWEEEKERHLHDIDELGVASSVSVLLGPEGGLTTAEVAGAREQGFLTVSLGKRILRAETATLSAVSIVQYLSGNL